MESQCNSIILFQENIQYQMPWAIFSEFRTDMVSVITLGVDSVD